MLRVTDTTQVYGALSGDVRAWFARRAPPDLVDDLVQDAFLRIHKGLAGLRDGERLLPWVYRVCRSVLIDRIRAVRPEDPLELDVADPTEAADDATQLVAAWLPGLVETLPEPYREAVRLSELEGCSQADVARRLGLSPSGARSRVQRGRRMLRERLDACCAVRLEGGAVVSVEPRSPCRC